MFTFILEIIFEGASEAVSSKKVSMPVRIILAAVLLVLWLGICGLLLAVGIKQGKTGLIILSALIFIAYIIITAGKIKELKG
ncbi:MAG: hypothetical protein E7488_06300 [Ruminococcaceae bacterium]|nr:hypothetical protein [Oscillospiraceae bacterium]